MSNLDNVAAEWLAARTVIVGFLRELRPDHGQAQLEHNAAAIIARLAQHDPPIVTGYASKTARRLAEWHDDDGDVLWWTFPIDHPPYCGTPLDSDWPDWPDEPYWTPFDVPEKPAQGAIA